MKLSWLSKKGPINYINIIIITLFEENGRYPISDRKGLNEKIECLFRFGNTLGNNLGEYLLNSRSTKSVELIFW